MTQKYKSEGKTSPILKTNANHKAKSNVIIINKKHNKLFVNSFKGFAI